MDAPLSDTLHEVIHSGLLPMLALLLDFRITV